MNSINLPFEYIMQMYVNALAKKGVDKVLLLETLEEVNETAIKCLAMANDEIVKKTINKVKKPTILKSKTIKPTPIVKKYIQQHEIDDIKTTNPDIEHKVAFKPTPQDVEKLFSTPSPSPKAIEAIEQCKFQFKGGKKNGTMCGKPVVANDFCASHNKMSSHDEKHGVLVLSDTEQVSANQVVSNKKIPCQFKLTAGKNKGKFCGKIECKAHMNKVKVEHCLD